MLKTPYSFSLDIIKPTKIPIMEFYQTDVNTSQMDISITNNDEVVDLTGHTLILNIKKADGTEIQNLATISDTARGIVNVSLTTQSLTAIGECRVQLTIFLGETRKSTHEFKYYVKSSMLNAEVPLSSNEYGLLLQLIDDVQEVENILNTSETERVEAENKRIELANNMTTLKGEIQTLQAQLNTLKNNVEVSEEERRQAEILRLQLQQNLLLFQLDLIELQNDLNDLNSTVNSDEEERKANEIQREINEEDRVELKDQLQGLKGTLEGLEVTFNTNEGTRNTTVYTKVSEVDNKIVSYDAVIVDIQNRFALLSSSVQQASEVINARTSTIRNKTFVDLDSRIEEIEKDILTSQSTSVVDSVVPFNTLANSLDGATDVSIKGQTLVNLLGTQGTQEITLTSDTTNNRVKIYSNIKLKANQTYTIIVNVTGWIPSTNGLQGFYMYARATDSTDVYPTPNVISTNKGYFKKAFTFPKDTQDFRTYIIADSEIDTIKYKEIILLEGDYATQEIPYFEGVASVEGGTSVIKSIGENLFDGILESGNIGTTTGSNNVDSSKIRSKNFIRVKANGTFKISLNGVGKTVNVFYYDINKNYMYYELSSTPTIPTGCGYIRISYTSTDTTEKILINEGTTIKTYTPYKESKTQLSDYIDAQYFPLRSVSPTVYDEVTSGKVYKRIKEKILQTSDIINVITTQSELDFATISQPGDILGYPIFSEINGIIVIEGIAQRTNETINSTNMLGKFTLSMSSGSIRIGVTKGTTLAQAQTQLVGKKLIYQLATPIEITLDRKINIPIFKNGTIIQEPSKMFAKLSYSFPLNIGRSVESIVNNLSWIKDNQQFIMNYLLDLDTRLTLGGH